MANNEIVIKIFVASPSDVAEERHCLEENVNDFNLAWSNQFGISLKLVRWETDSYPGIGKDAQEVINTEIPDDYDVFLGIMGHRFGTPTKRAGSGTQEEFMRAKKRYETNGQKPEILFYFKEGIIQQREIDPEQLTKVISFRDQLKNDGVYYFTFVDTRHFEKLVRLHLAKLLCRWKAQADGINNRQLIEEAPKSPTINKKQDNDLGMIELFEKFESSFELVTNITQRCTTYTVNYTSSIETRTKEIDQLKKFANEKGTRNMVKYSFDKAAQNTDEFATLLEPEMPKLSDAFSEGIESFIRLVMSFTILKEDGTDEKKATIDSIRFLISSSDKAENSVIRLKQTIQDTPDMTTAYIRSKKRIISVLDKYSRILHAGKLLTHEAELVLTK